MTNSREKFEAFLKNHGDALFWNTSDAMFRAWLAGRESMRDEAANKIYLYAGEDMGHKQRVCFSCVEIIRKIES